MMPSDDPTHGSPQLAPPPLDGLDAAALIDAEVGAILEVIEGADLEVRVPWLGRWRVRDVIAHLGGVHRWATRIVQTRSMDGPSFTRSRLRGDELTSWFTDGANELVATLRVTALDEACPNFNPGSPATARFWHRRQLHETTVHRWDIDHALGHAPLIASDVAVDGVDEYLDVWIRTRGKQTLTATLNLATPTASWNLRPSDKPGRLSIAPGLAPDAAAQLTGEPAALLLVLWNRITIDRSDLDIQGDPDVAHSFRSP